MADHVFSVPTTTIKTRLTVEGYLALYEDYSDPVQLIDGEVVFLDMAKELHQYIVTELMWILMNDIKPHQRGELRTAPTDVYFDDLNYYQPDIFFVAKTNERCFVNSRGVWQGPPDLVIEILSPSTTKHDRVEKFDTYEKHGVREYWMLDPEARVIEVYVLGEDGAYHRRAYGEEVAFTCHVLPTVQLKVAQLFPPKAE